MEATYIELDHMSHSPHSLFSEYIMIAWKLNMSQAHKWWKEISSYANFKEYEDDYTSLLSYNNETTTL